MADSIIEDFDDIRARLANPERQKAPKAEPAPATCRNRVRRHD